MFVRVVEIICKVGMQAELRRVGRDVLVPINKKAGCVEVYFLEPIAENDDLVFGVVSIWKNKETLEEMKKSESYRALVEELEPLIESIGDHVYFKN